MKELRKPNVLRKLAAVLTLIPLMPLYMLAAAIAALDGILSRIADWVELLVEQSSQFVVRISDPDRDERIARIKEERRQRVLAELRAEQEE